MGNALPKNYFFYCFVRFFAHEHGDSFRVYSDKSGPLVSLFVAPSMTSFQNYNPSARMYEYGSSKAVTNYYQYFSNLTKNNEQGFVSYSFGYDFLSLYNVTDMSPQSFVTVLEGMADGGKDVTSYELWYNNQARPIECDAICRALR